MSETLKEVSKALFQFFNLTVVMIFFKTAGETGKENYILAGVCFLLFGYLFTSLLYYLSTIINFNEEKSIQK